jgi:hypothetical protein
MMRRLLFGNVIAALFLLTQTACTSQSNASSQGMIFKSNLRVDGTAFYSMDSQTGQVYYMLDFGDNRGKWLPFGGLIAPQKTGNLLFDVVERAANASFYALDARTGQLFYTNDDQNSAGKWLPYGDPISTSNTNFQFEATGRMEGNSFYAINTQSRQMYFMNDFGDDAGKWKPYGETIGK